MNRTIKNQLPRDMVKDILSFIYDDNFRYVGIISGLAMTGKTSMLCLGQLNSLSIFEPFCIFADRGHIFLSTAIPENLQCFTMSCEIAELLDVEPSAKFEKDGYWHDEMIEKNAASRAFALELCLPSLKMIFFADHDFSNQEIAEFIKIDISVVEERLSIGNLTKDTIKNIVNYFRLRVKI